MDRETGRGLDRTLDPRSDPNQRPRRSALRRAVVSVFLVAALGAFVIWLPPVSRRSLAASLIANRPLILLLGVFALISLSLLWSFGHDLDVWVFNALNLGGPRASWLDRAMEAGSLPGNQWFIALLVVGAYVLGSRSFGLTLALGSLSLWLVVTIVKELTDRARPFHMLQEIRLVGYRERGRSFPSGHTAQTFYWVTLAVSHFRLPLAVAVGLYFLAALVALTRVYLGVHYPRDVTAGAILAIIWGIIGTLVAPYV